MASSARVHRFDAGSKPPLTSIAILPASQFTAPLTKNGPLVDAGIRYDFAIICAGSNTQSYSAWGPDADRHAKPLIHLAVEGALLGAYSHQFTCGFIKHRLDALNDWGNHSSLRNLDASGPLDSPKLSGSNLAKRQSAFPYAKRHDK